MRNQISPLEKIEDAISNMEPNKDPTSYAFSSHFYNKEWNSIKQVLHMKVEEPREHTKVARINSFLTLISNKRNPNIFSHFFPTSFSYISYKIIHSILKYVCQKLSS